MDVIFYDPYKPDGYDKALRDIAEQFHLSVKTVETHRENIKRKLGLRDAAALVHYATLWVRNEGGQAK